MINDTLWPTAWLNPPKQLEALDGGGYRITTHADTDFFNDPTGKHMKQNGHFWYKEVRGDFIARACIRPQFLHVWDAGCVMVRKDADTWAKLCYEQTDFGLTAIVSVVTKGVSDDANGVLTDAGAVHLQMVRQGNVFAMHYAPDGVHWQMVRIFSLDVAQDEAIQVGINSQCPGGEGTAIDVLSFEIIAGSVGNMRAGV